MTTGHEHGEQVDAWLRAAPEGLSQARQIRRFERAFSAVLRRAQQSLGEVTVTAIFDRVIYLASEKFPFAAAIEVAPPAGIVCRAPLEDGGAQREQVVELMRFVLTTFLTILGNLTAQILSPALHAELMREERARDDGVGSDARVDGEHDNDGGVAS